jgi:hypothetical protein
MTEMRDKDTISKGPKKREAACLETQHAILIPAGTILRQEPGKPGVFTCPVAHGVFKVTDADHPDTFKRVVA